MINLELSERDLKIILMALAIRINQLRVSLMERDSEEDSKNFLDTLEMLEKIQTKIGECEGP